MALIRRGTVSFATKVNNVTALGAVGAIIFNNTDGELSPYLGSGSSFIPTMGLAMDHGDLLQSFLLDHKSVTVSCGQELRGDLMADFSSRGPVAATGDIKPDVVAPGVNTWSTLPLENGEYGYLSGTSMAAPHVAGAAALLRKAHPDRTALDIKSALMGTAFRLRTGAGRPTPSTPNSRTLWWLVLEFDHRGSTRHGAPLQSGAPYSFVNNALFSGMGQHVEGGQEPG